MADTKISELPEAGPITGDELILLSQDGSDATMALSDLRVSDLLPMPATAANQIDLLIAIFDDDSNFAGVQCTCPSGFIVDWGDGSTPSETSSNASTILSHKYEWDDIDPGTLTSEGFRQALVKVTPRVGGNQFSAISISPSLSSAFAGLSTSYRTAWLAIQVNAPAATSFNVGTSGFSQRYLKEVSVVALGAITNVNGLFSNCYAIEKMTFLPGIFAAVTSANAAFINCFGVHEIEFGAGDFSDLTDATNMFNGALRRLKFGAGAFAALTTTTNMFLNCPRLTRIEGLAIPVSFSVAQCALGPDALDEIFTALPTVSGRTITITGNWGISGCDTTIATAKGWTVAS